MKKKRDRYGLSDAVIQLHNKYTLEDSKNLAVNIFLYFKVLHFTLFTFMVLSTGCDVTIDVLARYGRSVLKKCGIKQNVF